MSTEPGKLDSVVLSAEVKRAERAPKGVVPPALKVGEAIALAHKVNELAGGIASYDLFSQISGNTKTSSTFQRKVSALRQYGIIEDRDNTVALSDLGNRIVSPKDEVDDLLATKEAFLRIDMLNKIYERHRGRILPEDQFLNNLLVQEFKVPREFSRAWVEHLKDAVQSAKLTIVRADGKTQLVEQPGTTSVVGVSIVGQGLALVPPPIPAITAPALTDFSGALPVPLGKGRIALVKLPDDWSAKRDLKRFLKMLELSLDELGEEGQSIDA